MKNKHIKVIAFDADDTLWDCQGHFEKVMQYLYDELTPWVDRETAAMELFATERKNMYLLGYGVKAFTLSMLETRCLLPPSTTSCSVATACCSSPALLCLKWKRH